MAQVLVPAIGLCALGVLTYILHRKGVSPEPSERVSLGLAVGVGAFFTLSYTILSFLRVKAGHATAYDMGNMEHIVYLLSGGRWSAMALGHLRPSLLLFVPFYKLFPSPYTLLTLQGAILASGGGLAYALGKRVGTPSLALLATCAFFLYPGLGWAWLFDFHPDCLLVPLALLALLLFKQGKLVGFVIAGICVALVKESFAPVAAFLGVYALVKKRWLSGAILATVGALYFAVAVKWVLPGYHYASGFGFWPWEPGLLARKASYFLSSLGPFLGVSFLSPGALPALPSLAASALANLPNYFSIRYHYTLTLLPFLIAGLVFFWGKGKTRPGLFPGLMISFALFHIFQSPSVLSWEFWLRPRSDHHLRAYVPGPDPVRGLVDMVPTGASLSYQNHLYRPGVARRESLYVFADGMGTARFLLVDTAGPAWVKIRGPLEVDVSRQRFRGVLREALERYRVIASSDGVLLLELR